MSSTDLAVAALLFAGLTGWLAASGASSAGRRRAEARRRRYVARHPRAANMLDVERRLTGELSGPQLDYVVTRIERDGLSSAMVWRWLERFGADALYTALASGVGYDDLVDGRGAPKARVNL